MPDLREVFEMSTQKVRPEPGALDRQHRRQQRSSAGRKLAVFASVAALIAVIVASVAMLRPASDNVQVGGTGPSGADVSEFTGKPFPSWATDGAGLYAYPLAGGEPTFLAGVPSDSTGRISVSPDGTVLAFPRRQGGTTQIWVVGVDGSGLRRLTHDRFGASDPAFSPDGRQVAYVGIGSNARHQIFVVDIATGATRQVTTGGAQPSWPAWSPDGTTLIVNRAMPQDVSVWKGSDHLGLFSVDVRTGTMHPLLMTAGASNGYASYAPDGTTIAFLHWVPGGPSTLATSRVDGRNLQVIGGSARIGGQQYAPVWSPDGPQIAFDQSDATGHEEGAIWDPTTGSTARIPASAIGWIDQHTLIVGL